MHKIIMHYVVGGGDNMSVSGGPRPVLDGLVNYYDFANIKSYPRTGSVIYSLVGSETGSDSASYVDQWTSSPYFPTFDSGSNLGVLNFVASPSGSRIFCYTDTTLFRDTEEFTICFFYKPGAGMAFHVGQSGSNVDGFGTEQEWHTFHNFLGETGKYNQTFVMESSTGDLLVTSSNDVADSVYGRWIDVTIVCNGMSGSYSPTPVTSSMYINGEKVAQSTGSNLTRSSIHTTPYYLLGGPRDGAPNGHTFRAWSGDMSMVKLYNRALTVDEIKQNYNAHRGRYNL